MSDTKDSIDKEKLSNKNTDQDFYFQVFGEGDYKFTVEFIDDHSDLINESEVIIEGTYAGDVFYDLSMGDDFDYFQITVPPLKEIQATLKNPGVNEVSITMKSYDENKEAMSSITGIYLYVSDPGERDIDNWSNVKNENALIYLGIKGNGNYEFQIGFETLDRDDDGTIDSEDAFPDDPKEQVDTDGDGVGDNSDKFPNDANETEDTDGDGIGDNIDAFPYNPAEWVDGDGDGTGDNTDTFPNDANETMDTDRDGVGDNADVFPDNASEWIDTDKDGIGDNSDAFPEDPAASKDTDGDNYPDEWNSGMSEENSTTGLKLDSYPDNTNKWKREESSSGALFLVIIIVIVIVVIVIGIALFVVLKRKTLEKEEIKDEDKKEVTKKEDD